MKENNLLDTKEESLMSMFTVILCIIDENYDAKTVNQRNKFSKEAYKYLSGYARDLLEERLGDILCKHTQTRWAKDDIDTESWKWYNAGYDDAIQDLKEEVYNKFGIKL